MEAHTSGFDVRMSRTVLTRFSPQGGAVAGCSHLMIGPWIQLTSGSVFAATSAANPAGKFCARALAASCGAPRRRRLVGLEVGQRVEERQAVGSLYTFHETPASSRASGIVSQVNLPAWPARPVVWVTSTGPPPVPSGSTVPDSAMTRFGSVGPSTEQK